MGRISEHDKEHLVPSDKGIVLYRKRLRRLIRGLQDGTAPPQAVTMRRRAIPTYGGDTVLRRPAGGGDDRAALRAVGEAVMAVQFGAEELDAPDRDATVIDRLKQLEAEGLEA